MRFEVQLNGITGKKVHIVELKPESDVQRILVDGQPIGADAVLVAPGILSILIGGQSFEIHATPTAEGKLKLQCGPQEFLAEVTDPRAWRGRKYGTMEVKGRQQIVAPMPGKVIRLLVAGGETVDAGQGLVVVEAMKMQNEIRSPKKGKVERLMVQEGQAVNAGDVLAWVE